MPLPVGAALCLCMLVLSGCGATEAINPTPLPTLPPAPTATPDVGFEVNVTAVPTARPHHVKPTPTRFVPPQSAYIALSSASGPPAQRLVVVRGGHLPPSRTVSLQWSLGSKSPSTSPISTTTRTGPHGELRSRFTVPASPPGKYSIVAAIDGEIVATAAYRVESKATLSGHVSPAPQGETVHIRGRHFLPRVKLLLVIYPMSVHRKPVILGRVRSNSQGRFAYTRTVRKLSLGQYAVRAWSQDALATQMAETFIQVVI